MRILEVPEQPQSIRNKETYPELFREKREKKNKFQALHFYSI